MSCGRDKNIMLSVLNGLFTVLDGAGPQTSSHPCLEEVGHDHVLIKSCAGQTQQYFAHRLAIHFIKLL